MNVDLKALASRLEQNNITKEAYAALLGVNLSTIYRKFKASDTFTVGEMHKTAEILNLTPTEAASIFFNQ